MHSEFRLKADPIGNGQAAQLARSQRMQFLGNWITLPRSGVHEQISEHAPKADNAAGSSRPEVAEQMEVQACDCAMPNYQGRASLEKAFCWGLRKLLFVPASTYGDEARKQQHRNMTEAAELAGNWTCL